MAECLRVAGVPKAENGLSTCEYLEYLKLKVTINSTSEHLEYLKL